MYSGPPMHQLLLDYVREHDLKRRTIAANMGISESRLSLMLNGKRRITVEEYMNFCQAIAVDPRKFYETA